MAISSAMYAAVTGLSALGTGMQTISNNIANVNTVGFKAGRTNYEDLISQNYFSGGKVNQRGTGVKVSSIQSMFTQGAFMSSAQDTDMAIAGEGFFSVRNTVTGAINYTRAGVFTLTKEGQLEDPSGNILQGWQMSIPKPGQDAVRIGMPTDVKITVLNAPPVASSQIKVVANLNSEDEAAYLYEKFELADKYAHDQAVGPAESARVSTIAGIYPTTDSPMVTLDNANYDAVGDLSNTQANPATIESSTDDIYDESFLLTYKNTLSSASLHAPIPSKLSDFKIISDATFNALGPAAQAQANAEGILSETQYETLRIDSTGPIATYNKGNVGHFTSATNNTSTGVVASGNEYFDKYFIALYNSYHPGANITSMNQFNVVDNSSVLDISGHSWEREHGFMTEAEFNSLVVSARAEARAEATAKGRDAYNTLYNNIYDSTYKAITSRLQDWQLEGNGFAGAWNAQDNPPIDPESYTYPQTLTIYDTLGAEHKLNVYYQPNPHMDNVWDYIITCDPLEDARKDSNNNLLFSDTASFSGLIQKGKITFSADGKDRHGGLIKDIEAQNIDLEKSKMATIDPKSYTADTSTTMRNATIGGYFKGSPDIDPYTGQQKASDRTYELTWGGNVKGDPVTSGMVWTDSEGNTGIIPVYDKQFAGPYEFGSGMTITFDTKDLPLRFGDVGLDAISATAHSEQIAWTNLQPNKEGYFDFDVAFVQSASMAMHPPYPEGMPTIYQKISMDMGAKNPHGLSENWILDEQSTTQYASKSNTIFANSDGYPSGSLQRVSIGEDGVLTGIYSNGRHQPLYQIGLTRFLNPWGLSKVGDNLFEETRYSGEGAMNEPGYGGTGTVLANFLEQSNVDLAEEIVNMIVTQRGFQANSKTVTTTDSMLAEVIEMKR
ncbi:hypothetical protein C4J81_12825 [Deltaproteobacteria bacterium Smac51]|nr:hypothetical protein C4J81_12825 [Deltaproteobacteria bacterium Smac51]